MKILTIADNPSKALWDFYDKSRLEGIDLILSCGDLPAAYLSFLVTLGPCPVFYVPGNHDKRYDREPPEGCVCVDNKIVTYNGIRIMGLGGSMRYNSDECQYTEKEMKRRISGMRWQIWRNKGFDILLTHAPAKGVDDAEDLPHQGFDCFNRLIEKYQPRYMVHGHVHMNYGMNIPRTIQVGNTTVVNAYERYLIEC